MNKSNDVADSCPVSYRTINQYGVRTAFATTIARLMAHALNTFYCRGALSNTVNLDTIGCEWTGEFDLNRRTLEEFVNHSPAARGLRSFSTVLPTSCVVYHPITHRNLWSFVQITHRNLRSIA